MCKVRFSPWNMTCETSPIEMPRKKKNMFESQIFVCLLWPERTVWLELQRQLLGYQSSSHHPSHSNAEDMKKNQPELEGEVKTELLTACFSTLKNEVSRIVGQLKQFLAGKHKKEQVSWSLHRDIFWLLLRLFLLFYQLLNYYKMWGRFMNWKAVAGLCFWRF